MGNKQWIEYGKSLREFIKEGLHLPGNQYCVSDDDPLLVGNVNQSGEIGRAHV